MVEASQKLVMPEKGVSWDFDADDTPEEPVRRPRTVTFETPARALAVNTTAEPAQVIESAPSSAVSATPTSETQGTVQYTQEEIPNSQSSTPVSSQAGDKPLKKSRFVIEDSNTAVSSPTVQSVPEPIPAAIETGSPVPQLGPSTAQLEHSFQGLGVSHTVPEQGSLPEVRKGRFSVKDTAAGLSSPVLSSIKTMPNESLLSPSRSLSSSPVEGIEGVRIGGPVDQPLPSGNI